MLFEGLLIESEIEPELLEMEQPVPTVRMNATMSMPAIRMVSPIS